MDGALLLKSQRASRIRDAEIYENRRPVLSLSLSLSLSPLLRLGGHEG